MKKILTLAVLALLASAPKSSHAVSDGTPSTGSFTIVNVSSLSAATASGSLTVLDTTTLRGTRVSIGAFTYTAGVQFQAGVSTVTAATNLAAAINANNPFVTAAFSAGQASITLTAIDVGTLYNSIGLGTSNSGEISLSGAFLTGGQNNATVSINAITLIQGRDWFVQDVASNTAVSLASAINHSPSLKNLVSAYWTGTGGTVFLRALLSPVAYTLAAADNSSNQSNITLSGPTMTGGAPGNLAKNDCYLGAVDALPTSNYPAGCIAYLSTDATHLYLSTQAVTGSSSWLAK